VTIENGLNGGEEREEEKERTGEEWDVVLRTIGTPALLAGWYFLFGNGRIDTICPSRAEDSII
jgi:hypothetical protein